MSFVDSIVFGCHLSRWDGDPGRCRWCNHSLRFPRRTWCSDLCSHLYAENHVWPNAKEAARARDKGCVDCRTHPADRPGLLEVDHQPPCNGQRRQGCQHHQDRLATRCQHHHRERHRAAV